MDTPSSDSHGIPARIRGAHEFSIHERMRVVAQEFHDGLQFIQSFSKSVTFFGSARFDESHPYYLRAQEVASRIVQDLGYAIVSGGGPGIMEASSRGADDAGGESLGLTIMLPKEQTTNPYVHREMPFHYFFTRKVALTYSAETYLYFPGGFGTLDELFEILTLKQTGKITAVPLVLFGSDFWNPFHEIICHQLRDTFKTISPGDEHLYTITDDIDEVIEIIRNAPVRKGEALLPPSSSL